MATSKRPVMVGSGELSERLGVSRPTLNRWLHLGKIPRPVKVGASLAWPAAVADQIVRDRGRAGENGA